MACGVSEWAERNWKEKIIKSLASLGQALFGGTFHVYHQHSSAEPFLQQFYLWEIGIKERTFCNLFHTVVYCQSQESNPDPGSKETQTLSVTFFSREGNLHVEEEVCKHSFQLALTL
jgi:hypothetical protein